MTDLANDLRSILASECFSSADCRNGAECNFRQFGDVGLCDKQDPCKTNPCQNDGSCLAETESSFSCLCIPGYTGTRCETDVNECTSNPCQNGATCIDQVNGVLCECTAGWEGILCEQSKCAAG